MKSLISADKTPAEPMAVASGSRLQLGVPSRKMAPLPLTNDETPEPAPQKPLGAGMLVLAPSQRVGSKAAQTAANNNEAATQPADETPAAPMPLHNPENVANSPTEPPAEPAELSASAEKLILKKIDMITPGRIEDIADAIAPGHVQRAFDDLGEQQVDRLVTSVAPGKINEIVEDIAPDMLKQTIRDIAREEVDDYVPFAMTEALEETVAHLIRQELAGVLGVRVTEKIRLLVQAEIQRASEDI